MTLKSHEIGKRKEAILYDFMEGFQKKKINYINYNVSFCRWLVSQLAGGHISFHEAHVWFNLGKKRNGYPNKKLKLNSTGLTQAPQIIHNQTLNKYKQNKKKPCAKHGF